MIELAEVKEFGGEEVAVHVDRTHWVHAPACHNSDSGQGTQGSEGCLGGESWNEGWLGAEWDGPW